LGIIIKVFLFISFFYLIADFFILKTNDLSLISLRKEFIVLTIFFSAICFFFLPLFNVGEYLQTQNIKSINQYKREYKLDFVFSFMGFIGLACWSISKHMFDVWWIIGTIFIVLCVLCILNISMFIISKSKKHYR
jgi:quinol-cytochrome oxidoreductase complex cytochrome b subunit